jgi:polysaccharide biosynthesis transport protein
MRRRARLPVLAEVPERRDGGARAGAQGRTALEAYSRLARALEGSGAVCTTGSARSAVAVGLATAATAEGRAVALLECDLAEPSLAADLGLSPAPGLHDYLREEAQPPRIVQPLVLAGPAAGRAADPLACIVAGASAASAAELLASARCAHAVEKLRHAYDLVVLSGPALDRDPDALRAVAGLADAAIACGTSREVPRRPPIPLAGLVAVG